MECKIEEMIKMITSKEDVFVNEGETVEIKLDGVTKYTKNLDIEFTPFISLFDIEKYEDGTFLKEDNDGVVTMKVTCKNGNYLRGGIYRGTWIKNDDILGTIKMEQPKVEVQSKNNNKKKK